MLGMSQCKQGQQVNQCSICLQKRLFLDYLKQKQSKYMQENLLMSEASLPAVAASAPWLHVCPGLMKGQRVPVQRLGKDPDPLQRSAKAVIVLMQALWLNKGEQ